MSSSAATSGVGEKRDAVIDSARGIAISLVLVGHALELFFLRPDGERNPAAFETWRLIYAFHLPAFYFLSGAVFQNLKARPFGTVLVNSLTLFLIAYTTQIVAAPLHSILFPIDQSPYLIVRHILFPVLTGKDFILVITWFLVSLGIVQLAVWTFLRSVVPVRILIVVALLASTLWAEQIHDKVFQVQSWAIGFLFFLAGVQGYGSWRLPRGGGGVAAFVAAAGLLAMLYPLNRGCSFNPLAICASPDGPEFAMHLASAYIGFLPIVVLAAAAGVAATVILANLVAGCALGDFIAWIGKHSLALLILNGAVLAFVQSSLVKIFPAQTALWALWASLIVALQIALIPIVGPLVGRLQSTCRRSAAYLVLTAHSHLSRLSQRGIA